MLNNLQNPIYQVTKVTEAMTAEPTEPVVETPEVAEVEPNVTFESTEVDTDYLFHSPEVLGWLSIEEQQFLFDVITAYISESDSILDVGCGRGDLYMYLAEKWNIDAGAYNYTGIDYNPYMIDIGQQKYPNVNLIMADIYDNESLEAINNMSADWVVASGAFNYKVTEDMYAYVFKCIDNMLKYANKGVAINLMTDYYDATDEALVSQMFKYDPVYVFSVLSSRYPKTVTRMDYMEGDVTFYILK